MELPIDHLPAAQQPNWPDTNHLNEVLQMLEHEEALVSSWETDKLTTRLGMVSSGEAFVLQAGPCAESFIDTPGAARDLLNVILPMTVVLAYGAGVPVVKIGRMAGQFGKPRSSDVEVRDGRSLPSYRGDIVNGPGYSTEERTPNPDRLMQAYAHSRGTLRAVRDLTTGGFADLEKMHDWNVKFAAEGTEGQREKYQSVVKGISEAIRFMKACDIDVSKIPSLHEAETFVSHEAVILGYEKALTRADNEGKIYDSSAHMLWVGERTRKINEAHVEFASIINNPVGVKLGPTATPEEVITLCEKLNPDNIPGRLTFIVRMGADRVGDGLQPILRAVRTKGFPVVWMSDPMHGNTITAETGQKTREFKAVTREVENFFATCRDEDAWPGGVHLEITGEDVTECLGGSLPTTITDLSQNYTTNCDPRLNPTQSVELAFLVSELLTKK